MTINLETEVVKSSFDPINRISTYTIQRDGKNYTAAVNLADLDKLGPAGPATKAARRTFIANALNAALQGQPDKEPEPKADAEPNPT